MAWAYQCYHPHHLSEESNVAKLKQRTMEADKPADHEVAATGTSSADDKTSMEDLEVRKRKKEKLKKGWKELPAGTTRDIRINRGELGKKTGKPYQVIDLDEQGREVSSQDAKEVTIKGESELVHEIHQGCGPRTGRVCLRTKGSILIKK